MIPNQSLMLFLPPCMGIISLLFSPDLWSFSQHYGRTEHITLSAFSYCRFKSNVSNS